MEAISPRDAAMHTEQMKEAILQNLLVSYRISLEMTNVLIVEQARRPSTGQACRNDCRKGLPSRHQTQAESPKSWKRKATLELLLVAELSETLIVGEAICPQDIPILQALCMGRIAGLASH